MKEEHLVIILENMDTKFALILEVYDALDRKIDTVNENLSQKIDAVATDLKAHRNDTEAHKIYRVKEGSRGLRLARQLLCRHINIDMNQNPYFCLDWN